MGPLTDRATAQGLHKGLGASRQLGLAGVRLPASRRCGYVRLQLAVARVFVFLQAPHPAAFSPAIQLLASAAAAPAHRPTPTSAGSCGIAQPPPPSEAPKPDPEERPGENGQTSLGVLQAGGGRGSREVGGGCPGRNSALPCSERRIKQLCVTSHFALKKTDLSF